MSEQTTNKAVSVEQATKMTTEFFARQAAVQEQLSDTRISFCFEFAMEEPVAAATESGRALSKAAKLLQSRNPGQVIAADPAHYSTMGLPTRISTGVGPHARATMAVVPSALDNDNFGDPDNFDVYRHFFGLVTAPANYTKATQQVVAVTDQLTGRPLLTTPHTDMVVRVMRPNLHNELSGLALALNATELEWLNRIGRTNGVIDGEATWTATLLKDMIARRFLASGSELNQDSPKALWLAELNAIARQIISEDSDYSLSIDPKGRFVDFSHVGGEDYHVDFGRLTQTVEDMALAVTMSCIPEGQTSNDYWSQPVMNEKLEEFIGYITELREHAQGITLLETAASFSAAAYNIFKGGEVIGKVLAYSDATPGGHQFDNCHVQIGDISEYVLMGEEITFVAALLSKRA